MLEAVSSALEQIGIEVTRANNGAELLHALADQGPFDLLVTDISMPWMSGLQVSRSARSAGLLMPLLFMTALRDDKLASQIAKLDARASLLHKPFEMSALVNKVTSMLKASAAAHP